MWIFMSSCKMRQHWRSLLGSFMYTVSMFMYQGGHASVIHHLMISVASNSGESDMMGGSPMLFLLKRWDWCHLYPLDQQRVFACKWCRLLPPTFPWAKYTAVMLLSNHGAGKNVPTLNVSGFIATKVNSKLSAQWVWGVSGGSVPC